MQDVNAGGDGVKGEWDLPVHLVATSYKSIIIFQN